MFKVRIGKKLFLQKAWTILDNLLESNKISLKIEETLGFVKKARFKNKKTKLNDM